MAMTLRFNFYSALVRGVVGRMCLTGLLVITSSLWAQEHQVEIPDAFANARFSQVMGGGGVPLNVVSLGDSAKPAILLLHGFRQSYLSWTKQFASRLSQNCHLVAFDLRGHGNSGSPWISNAYNHGEPWAQDVAHVIETLHLQRPLIVGWSFGGNVAMDFAAYFPHVPVAGYVLTGTAAGLQFTPNTPLPAVSYDLTRNAEKVQASMRLLFPSLQLETGLLSQFAAAAMRVGPWIEKAVAERARNETPPVITVPVTFVTGGKDPLVSPSLIQRLKPLFPKASFIDFVESGHAPFLDEPDRFNALLEQLQCDPA